MNQQLQQEQQAQQRQATPEEVFKMVEAFVDENDLNFDELRFMVNQWQNEAKAIDSAKSIKFREAFVANDLRKYANHLNDFVIRYQDKVFNKKEKVKVKNELVGLISSKFLRQ